MPGVLGIISNHKILHDVEIEYLSLSPFDMKKKTYPHLRFERFTNRKFLGDKVFEEDNDVLIGIEGILFNYADLRAKFNSENNFSLIKKMYEQNEDSFFNDFRGEFSGFVYDKIEKTIRVFTNHTASKPVYYYADKDLFIFASEVKIITQFLTKLGKSVSLDETGAYFLLTYGFMLHDFTLVHNVKKLLPGHAIKIQLTADSDDKISFTHNVSSYFRFSNTEKTRDSKTEIIEKIDEMFKKSITQEYEKDREYGYQHIATLSGGLDSRINVMMADKLGFKNISTMTFSEPGYWDDQIARQIARDRGFKHQFMSLENGDYLKNVDSPVIANDGQVFFSGAAHHLRMTGQVDLDEFGLQHTGMLAKAHFGAYLGNSINLGDGAYSHRLLGKIEAEFNKIAENYESAEFFKLCNRGFNGIFNGYWMTQQYTEFSSAFLDVDLINYALSIPDELKKHEQIYIDWIRTKHRDIGKYKWESTMTSINTWQPMYRIVGYSRRVLRALKRRLRLSRLYNMNPFEYWYRNNPSLQEFFTKIFDENISNLDDYTELKQDCIGQFNEGKTIQKAQVLTLLRAFKLLNLQ